MSLLDYPVSHLTDEQKKQIIAAFESAKPVITHHTFDPIRFYGIGGEVEKSVDAAHDR